MSTLRRRARKKTGKARGAMVPRKVMDRRVYASTGEQNRKSHTKRKGGGKRDLLRMHTGLWPVATKCQDLCSCIIPMQLADRDNLLKLTIMALMGPSLFSPPAAHKNRLRSILVFSVQVLSVQHLKCLLCSTLALAAQALTIKHPCAETAHYPGALRYHGCGKSRSLSCTCSNSTVKEGGGGGGGRVPYLASV
eukprot:scaffold42290_cov19-Tisochrysis_lutea.AAC.2